MKESRLMTFRIRCPHPGRPKPGEWTDVVCAQFGKNGDRLAEEAIINSFGGSDGGYAEARRLVEELNLAVLKFHRVDDPPLAGGVVCKCPADFCPTHGPAAKFRGIAKANGSFAKQPDEAYKNI